MTNCVRCGRPVDTSLGFGMPEKVSRDFRTVGLCHDHAIAAIVDDIREALAEKEDAHE